jgi:hypothetical protein
MPCCACSRRGTHAAPQRGALLPAGNLHSAQTTPAPQAAAAATAPSPSGLPRAHWRRPPPGPAPPCPRPPPAHLVLVQGAGHKLVQHRRHLQAHAEHAALALDADILGPLHEAVQVTLRWGCAAQACTGGRGAGRRARSQRAARRRCAWRAIWLISSGLRAGTPSAQRRDLRHRCKLHVAAVAAWRAAGAQAWTAAARKWLPGARVLLAPPDAQPPRTAPRCPRCCMPLAPGGAGWTRWLRIPAGCCRPSPKVFGRFSYRGFSSFLGAAACSSRH